MSRTAVIVALLVAIALAVGAYLSLGPNTAGGAGGPARSGNTPAPVSVAIDPAHVSMLTLSRADGSTETVRRGPAPGEWVLTLRPADGPLRDWPLNGSNVRGALRLLSTLDLAPAGDSAAPDAGSATTLVVTLDDGAERRLTFHGREIGGRILVTARTTGTSSESTGWLDAQTAHAIALDGPRYWRDRTPFAAAVPDASRITIRTPSALLMIARSQGRWRVTEPLVAPADPEAIEALAKRLAALEIAEFDDAGEVPGPHAQGGGLHDPAAIITVERIIRSADGDSGSRTLATSLALGTSGPDVGGKRVYASIDRGDGPAFVIVAAEQFGAITTEPAAYLSSRSVQTPPADVGSVFVRRGASPNDGGTPDPGAFPRRFHRKIDAWVRAGADGGDVPASKEDSAAVDALLKVLAKDKCISVSLAAPKGYAPVATVQTGTLDGSPLETVEVGTCEAGAGGKDAGRVVTRVGPVYRVCAPEADALLPWVSAEGP